MMRDASSARLVRDARRAAGLTQAELARRIRTSRSTISDFETGRRSPSLETLHRIAAAGGLALEVHLADQARSATAVLRQHQALLEAIFDASGSQIFVKDLDGRYLLANRQIEIESGVAHDDMIDRTDHDLFPAAEVDAWRANDLAVLAAKEPSAVEETFERPDGTQTFLSLKFPLLDSTGEPYALAGVSTNITERKRTEEALAAADRAKTEFLSRMSHELRTPLNAVLGFAQLLEMDELDGSQRESVEQILKGARHLLELINEVLDIARIESGQLSLSLEPVGLASVIDETIALMAALAADRELSVEVEPPDPVSLTALADRQRLRQVLLNLVSNAVKYTPPGGRISVSSATLGNERVAVAVRDTGVGIAPDHLALLFAPFERLGAETTAVEGTGVGLALSKGLVELMGGSISVASTPAVGSTFTVVLPTAEPSARSLEAGLVAATAVPPQLERRQPAVVLYIEDNESNVRLVERILAQRSHLVLVPALTGASGIELAVTHRPAVILLDLHLPDIHGSAVMHDLRRDPRTRDIPIVVLTADASKAQRKQILARGARAFLSKPIEIDELLATLDDVLHDGRSR